MTDTPRPLVSVVIPNYNYEKTLRLCLESVYAQDYRPIEVIVADDASTDRSRDIVAGFPATLVALGGNGGVSVARNAGVAAAGGEILFFLDSDEALDTDTAITAAVEMLERDPGLGCVHGILAAHPLIDDGPVERYHALHAHFWRRRAVGTVHTALFAQAAMPRRVFDEIGPFDESLRDAEDVEYSERLSARYRIALTDRITARHDDVDRLGPMLAEQFRRSLQLVPTVLLARTQRSGGLKAYRWPTVLAAGLTAASTAGPALAWWSGHWWPAALPLLCAALFLIADPGLLRFVAGRGITRFYGLHLLATLAMLAGAVTGGVRHLLRATGRRVRLALAFGIVAASFAAVAAPLAHDGPALARVLGNPATPRLIAFALLFNAAGLWLGMLSWRALLRDDDGGLPLRDATRIFFIGQLGKYVPGPVWSMVAHVRMGRDANRSAPRMLGAYLSSFAIAVVTGALVGLLAVPGTGGAAWLAVPVLALAVVMARPRLVTTAVRRGAALLRRGEPRPVAPRAIRASIALATASWLVSGLHLWILMLILGAAPARSLPAAIGAFALATTAGTLTLVVPDGWGVREITLTAALATVLPLPVAGAAAIGSRLVCLVCEIASSTVALLLVRRTPAFDTLEGSRV